MFATIAGAVLPPLIKGGMNLLGNRGNLSPRKQMAYQDHYTGKQMHMAHDYSLRQMEAQQEHALRQIDYQSATAGRWRDEQRLYDRDSMVRLVEDAERAGFNPLTALRGGGGAGYQQTHAPMFGGSMPTPTGLGGVTGVSPGYSEGGNAMAAFGNAIANGIQAAFDYDPLEEEKAQIELDIMRGQLRRINEGGGAEYTRFGNTPTAKGSRFKTNVDLAKGLPLQAGDRTVTNPYPTHWDGEVAPGYVDAEAWEQRYGDIIGGLAAGTVNAYGDIAHNVRRSRDRRNNGDIAKQLDAWGEAWDRFRVRNGAQPKNITRDSF